jgi:tetratricopeptide (TPR) repeat protein
LEAFRRGDHEQAIISFDAALKADPNLADVYFARGRAYQKWGLKDKTKLSLAITDYGQAEKLAPHGRNLAAIAFCHTCLAHDGAALEMYRSAVKAGFENAELYNNMGFCYNRTPPTNPAEARKCFDKAIELNPTLQAPYYNRALMCLLSAKNPMDELETIRRNPQAATVRTPEEMEKMRTDIAAALTTCVADFQKALDLGPPSGELSYQVANAYATAFVGGNDWKEHALRHLARAVKEQNLDPKILAIEPLLRDLQQDPRFQALANQPPPPQPMVRAVRFVDPVQDPAR